MSLISVFYGHFLNDVPRYHHLSVGSYSLPEHETSPCVLGSELREQLFQTEEVVGYSVVGQ